MNVPEVVSSPLANTTSACPSTAEPDAQQLACVTDTNNFAVLDVDTARPDPQLVARILDEAGVERARMTVLASQLR